MSSEIIVVLVLTVIAAGFIVWVRMKSEPSDQKERTHNRRRDGESLDS